MASIDGPLRRVMTRPIDRPPDRSTASATRRADATRRRTTDMALRDASNDASAGGQPPGSAAKLRELQSRCVSNDRDDRASRARVVITRAVRHPNGARD